MDEPIKIIHFSDTHITPRPQFMVKDFNNAVNAINITPHDFTIFSGDLTHLWLYVVATILGAILAVYSCKLVQAEECCDNC